jgi:O-antigen/teichoic acid export membrane protein
MARVRNDSLLRNSMYIMATTLVTAAFGYLFWIIAAHTYSAASVGLAAALISAMTLASSVSGLGIGAALIQILPRSEPGQAWSAAVSAAFVVGIASGVLAGSVLLVVLPLVSGGFGVVQQNPLYAGVLIAGVALWTISTMLDYIFMAERAAGNMLLRNILFSLLKIALLIVAVEMLRAGALGIFASSVLASALAAACATSLLVPRLGRSFRLSFYGLRRQVRSMLRYIAGHHMISVGSMLPMYLLPTLVAARLTVSDTAYFYTTWMLGSLFFMISPSVATSLFAEGSSAAEDLHANVRNSARVVATMLAPIMVLFLVCGRYIMAVFGPSYVHHGLLLLSILVISAIPDAITNLYVATLRVQRRLLHAMYLNLSMAGCTLVLAWMLLPTLGLTGAGWAWLIAQSAGSLVVGVAVLRARSRGAPGGSVTAGETRAPLDARVGMNA